MRVGTRESKLAMRQTEIFCQRMAGANPDIDCEVVGLKSLGDIDLTSPLNQMAATGAFVRELDEAMIKGAIDCSVNSLKDIPIDVNKELMVVAVFPRDADEDVILPCPLEELPQGARVGTASVRREKQLHEVRPDLEIVNLRGNIHTRLQRLDDGDFDAIILAKAGLDRMGIDRPMHVLDKTRFIPAPAQGAIAVECRKSDDATRIALQRLDDMPTRIATGVERGIMKLMGAGCSSPVGINATVEGDMVRVRAVSYDYTEEPRRVETVLPCDYIMDELLDIAEYLTGKRDTI
ncbi:MAG TPA: hydroxymethylbilane synthase [Euryarchaeota archaeon]|jgi:hydroxymethylbilane synthase|nr:hydroxymethylbilane synthase [Euryarchaeota archaeon]